MNFFNSIAALIISTFAYCMIGSAAARDSSVESSARFQLFFSNDSRAASFNDSTDNFIITCDKQNLFYMIITTKKVLKTRRTDMKIILINSQGINLNCVQDQGYIACHGEYPATLLSAEPSWGEPAMASIDGSIWWNMSAETLVSAVKGIRQTCRRGL